MVRNRIPNGCFYFVPRNGIPSCFFFRGMVQNGIPSTFLLCRTVQNGNQEFSVLRNSRNSAGTNQLFRLFSLPRNNFFVGNCQPPLFITTAVMVLYILNLQFTVNMVFLCSSCSWHVLYSRKFSVDIHDLRSFDTSPTLGCPPIYCHFLVCVSQHIND
jgi:hypothetical protein